MRKWLPVKVTHLITNPARRQVTVESGGLFKFRIFFELAFVPVIELQKYRVLNFVGHFSIQYYWRL